MSSPPFFQNLVGGSTPPAERGGAHYVIGSSNIIIIQHYFVGKTDFSLKIQNSIQPTDWERGKVLEKDGRNSPGTGNILQYQQLLDALE